MPSLGNAIAKARKAKHLSQKELAARITKEDGGAISPQYLNDIERDRRAPSEFVIGRLASELNLDEDRDYLCLLTGHLPKDVLIADAPPKVVTKAFRLFRRRIDRR